MTHASEPHPGLVSAAFLAAAHECARRIRQGDDIVDVPRYVRVRGEKLTRDHARLWAAMPDADPIDFAKALEPGLSSNPVPTTPPVRVINGVEHRHILGTGWCPPLPIDAYEVSA